MQLSWNGVLITLQAAGPALSNSTVQTSLLNGQAKFPLPGQFTQFVGQRLRMRAAGILSTALSAPGTLSLFAMAGSTAVYAGGPSPTLPTSLASAPWVLELAFLMRSVGSTAAATLAGSGTLTINSQSPYVLACPGALTGFDSTVPNIWDLQAAFSVASASNAITCEDYALYSDN
jgi:hypothetical protein